MAAYNTSSWLGNCHHRHVKLFSHQSFHDHRLMGSTHREQPPRLLPLDSTSSFHCWIWHHSLQLRTLHVLLVALLLSSSLVSSHSDCKFPEHWWGKWFQKGVPDLIHISKYNISDKGVCRQINSDKYIIENRSEKCVRCLAINERHLNLLQYKETNICYDRVTPDICFDINGDAPLYSLVRVNTSPIKCPFKGPYSFSYSKGINECKDPLSEIDECTDDKRLLLKFKACADVIGSESKVEELECFAEWKEGSYKYLVGKLHHNAATTDEDRIRCFVIEKNNADTVESYNIGQSGDASCDGLFSPRDGLRTFKIRKVPETAPKCRFPNWLVQGRHWKTLDNRQVYDMSVPQVFTVHNLQPSITTDRKEVVRVAKCIESDDVSYMHKFNASRFVIHTTLGCKSGFTCMMAYLREERIVELQIGNIVSHLGDACSMHNFNPSTVKYTTLTTFDDSTKECSLKGIFSVQLVRFTDKYRPSSRPLNMGRQVSFLDQRFTCQDLALKLKSNCEDMDQFQFTCNENNRVKNLKCRGSWRENNTQMFLVSFIEKFNYEYCINLNLQTNEMKMVRNSHFCYRETQHPDSSGTRYFDLTASNRLPEEHVSFALINEGSCNANSAASLTTINKRALSSPIWLAILVAQYLLVPLFIGQAPLIG